MCMLEIKKLNDKNNWGNLSYGTLKDKGKMGG